jgi:hypothetical protein
LLIFFLLLRFLLSPRKMSQSFLPDEILEEIVRSVQDAETLACVARSCRLLYVYASPLLDVLRHLKNIAGKTPVSIGVYGAPGSGHKAVTRQLCGTASTKIPVLPVSVSQSSWLRSNVCATERKAIQLLCVQRKGPLVPLEWYRIACSVDCVLFVVRTLHLRSSELLLSSFHHSSCHQTR